MKNFLRFYSITPLFLSLVTRTPGMNRTMLNSTQALFVLALLSARSLAADSSSEAPVFKDKILEKAVRKFVFDKRDNDKPIVETDVVNLSTIQGVGMEIADLSGLEKCANLASLDLSKNRIKDLTPLKGLSKLQYLNLADNQIEDIAPLAEDMALQYLELSNNQVKDLKPLHGLTNLASLYLSNNQITDISPIVKLPWMASGHHIARWVDQPVLPVSGEQQDPRPDAAGEDGEKGFRERETVRAVSEPLRQRQLNEGEPESAIKRLRSPIE
ncbi:MAG: hypothetical protein DME21_17920 [Verrucomicrobia bacterium]|nr:MAG: hypothetical protein DME21_17920 [Verrucomicrobiota bacterium]